MSRQKSVTFKLQTTEVHHIYSVHIIGFFYVGFPHHRSDGLVFFSSNCVKLRACDQEGDQPRIQFTVFNRSAEQFRKDLQREKMMFECCEIQGSKYSKPICLFLRGHGSHFAVQSADIIFRGLRGQKAVELGLKVWVWKEQNAWKTEDYGLI